MPDDFKPESEPVPQDDDESFLLQADRRSYTEKEKAYIRRGLEERKERQGEMNKMMMDVQESGDERKEVAFYVECAKDNLKYFGVENLSNIEGVRLRNTVERLLPQYKLEKESVKNGELSPATAFDIGEESAVLWLYENYGIHEKDIPRIYTLEDITDEKKYTFEVLHKDSALAKQRELKKQNHKTMLYFTVPDDFKEYLQQKRDEAHHKIFK